MTSAMTLQSSLLLNAITGLGFPLGFTDRPQRENLLGKWEKGEGKEKRKRSNKRDRKWKEVVGGGGEGTGQKKPRVGSVLKFAALSSEGTVVAAVKLLGFRPCLPTIRRGRP